MTNRSEDEVKHMSGQQADEAAEVDPLIGAQLGSFKLIRLLGHGGMGAVYLGEQVQIGSKVAVKLLHEHLAVHPSLVQRFYAEARAVNLIGHENIVSIFDMSFAPPARYYYIMEYLEGCSLAQFALSPLADDVCIPILQQVCDGLEAAHARGVVHRDLKPENIFLTKRGRMERFVKILDFGIAKLFSAENAPERTRPGILVGTPEYCPPEQAAGDEADPRFDLYALGIIAYRLTTGRLPYTGKTIPQVLVAHREVIPTPPHELSPRVSKSLSQLIVKAIAKSPKERFQSAAEFRDALSIVAGDLPADWSESPFAKPRTAPPEVPKTIVADVGPEKPRAHVTPDPVPGALAVHARILTRGTPGERLRGADVSRAGMFLCTEAPFPPLMTRLNLELEISDQVLQCTAEVVRHVNAEQASAWSMSSGFGVQFVDLSPATKETLVQRLQGRASAPTRVQRHSFDPAAERALQNFLQRKDEPYPFLGLTPDATFADIRQRTREAKKELDELQQGSLAPGQLQKVQEQLKRLEAVVDRIGTPVRRVEYDAEKGNFRGVARCIAAGLTITELELARKNFLRQRTGAESRSYIHLATARSWETREQFRQALEEYEKALLVDPINVEAQQRYWSLRKRLEPR